MLPCSSISHNSLILRLLDFFIVCFFVSPLVVCYWQGTWVLMDIYIFPDSFFFSALLSTGLGVMFSHFILATQTWIVGKLSNYNNKNYLQFAWQICVYLTSIFCISFWRGVWMLMDMFTGFSLTVFLICHGMAFVFLTLTRTTSSIVFCPGYLLKDQTVSPSTSFNFTVMPLSLSCIKDKSFKMCWSHFLTVFCISPTLVCYWRATWNLCVYLANMAVGTGLTTCMTNAGFGYVVSLLCFLISQPLERTLSSDSLAWPYLVKASIEHLFIYVLGFASVNVWSGLWCLVEQFLVIPGQENNYLSALLRHCISFLALYMAEGTINLVGCPAGCRTHGSNTLEGLFMGTYFIFSETSALVTGKRVEVTPRTIQRKMSQATQSDGNATLYGGNMISRKSNTTCTEVNMNGEESNATHEDNTKHTEMNMNKKSNATHTEGNAQDNMLEEERNAEKENKDAGDDMAGNDAKDTATAPRVADGDDTVVQGSVNTNYK